MDEIHGNIMYIYILYKYSIYIYTDMYIYIYTLYSIVYIYTKAIYICIHIIGHVTYDMEKTCLSL